MDVTIVRLEWNGIKVRLGLPLDENFFHLIIKLKISIPAIWVEIKVAVGGVRRGAVEVQLVVIIGGHKQGARLVRRRKEGVSIDA